MTWVQTVTGTAVDLLDPKPEQIKLKDIVWSLARIPRFLGHTVSEVPLSVAQHSLTVEALLPQDACPQERLAALLHDAHEAYIGDMPSPVKTAMSRLTKDDAFATLASRLDEAIYIAFGLPWLAPAAWSDHIAAADLLALRLERDRFMAPPPREWGVLPQQTNEQCFVMESVLLTTAMSRNAAEQAFLGRIRQLQNTRHGFEGVQT